jgi:hypothetical protein
LLKLQYSIKVFRNHGKSKGSLAFKIPKSVQYSYDDSCKLMVNMPKQPATVPQHGDCVSQNRVHDVLRKQTELLYILLNSILWAQAEEV